jgi:glycosyltransferase involved in cell wall biosynthesis
MALISRQSISVVFPAYNEQGNVAQAIQQANDCLRGLTEDWEIIVVNDGSSDQTAAVMDAIAANDARVVPIHHRNGNRGYGAALKSGIERASKNLIFFSDSDLQFHLAELPLLLLWIEQYDAVIGYREKRNDRLHRKMNALGWNILVRMVLGLRVRDIDCAFKLFRASVFDSVRIDAVGAMVNTDILVQLIRKGFLVKEVPVTHFPRVVGKSTGANLRVIVKAFRELVRLRAKLATVKPVIVNHERRREESRGEFQSQRLEERRRVRLPINFEDRRQRWVARETPGVTATGEQRLPKHVVDEA